MPQWVLLSHLQPQRVLPGRQLAGLAGHVAVTGHVAVAVIADVGTRHLEGVVLTTTYDTGAGFSPAGAARRWGPGRGAGRTRAPGRS